MAKLARLLLYVIAVAYPWYEFHVERTGFFSYEGVGAIVFPVAVVLLELLPGQRKLSLRHVFSTLLGAAVLATLAQLVYLGFLGYLAQPLEMKRMIHLDWTVMPFAVLILWFLKRGKSRA